MTTNPSAAVPLTAIFLVQSILTMAAYSIPMVIPIAAADMGLEAASVGYVTSLTYATAMLTGLASGTLVARLGATGTFRLLLAVSAAGTVVMGLGFPVAVFAGAILLGCATGPMNPTGSHVLARVTHRRNRAFVFSIKQCGTPAGGMLAGAALPPLLELTDWPLALACLPVVAGVALWVLAPAGRLGNLADEAGSTSGQGIARSLAAVREVLGNGPVRTVTLTGLVLATCQMGLATFLVVYLMEVVELSPAQAGLVFATLHLAGICARLVLGMLADHLQDARWILAGICIVLASAQALVAEFDGSWAMPLIYAVTIGAGASGNGWVGLFFAELARLSPPNRTADIAGGSQFIMYIGIAVGPMLFSLLLALTDSYHTGFRVMATLALLAGLTLVFGRRSTAGS